MSLGLVRGKTDLLFCSYDCFSVELNQKAAIDKEIAEYHPDKLLNTPNDALVNYFLGLA